MTTHSIQTLTDKGYCYGSDDVLIFTDIKVANERNGFGIVKGKPFYCGLGSCIAANPENGTYGEMKRKSAANMVHEVTAGDIIECNGERWMVVDNENAYQRQALFVKQ